MVLITSSLDWERRWQVLPVFYNSWNPIINLVCKLYSGIWGTAAICMFVGKQQQISGSSSMLSDVNV